MPGIVWCNRTWAVSSDIIPVVAFLGVIIHLPWCGHTTAEGPLFGCNSYKPVITWSQMIFLHQLSAKSCMYRVVIIIVSQFIKGGFNGCYNTASSLQHLVVLSLLLLTFSAVLLVELAIIVVGSRGGSQCCHLAGKGNTRLLHNPRDHSGEHAAKTHHRRPCWLAGTPLEVSKRRLMRPLLTIQLALWVLQFMLAGRPSLPAYLLLPARVPCTDPPCQHLSLSPMIQGRGHVSSRNILEQSTQTAPALHSLLASATKEDAGAWGMPTHTHALSDVCIGGSQRS